MSEKTKAILITSDGGLTDEAWDEIQALGEAVGLPVFAVTSRVKVQVVEADVSALLVVTEKAEGESVKGLTERVQKALE